MIAGIPGGGIGGLFYLIGALLAPVWELVRLLKCDASPRRWALALRHFLLAACILLSVAGSTWLVGLLAASPVVASRSDQGLLAPLTHEVIGRRVALITATTLAAVLIAVEALRFIVKQQHAGPLAPTRSSLQR